MSTKTATIIGVTGLIGSHLYELIKRDRSFETIRLIVRRPMPKDDPLTEIKLVDFDDAESLMLAIEGSDVVFCCVGTTSKKVKGDNEAYRKIDHDIPVRLANYCRTVGCEVFVFVSAIGADSKSKNFYLQLKGETEEDIRKAGLRSVHFMRPSLLLGNRKEFRLGERIGKIFMTATFPFWPSRYKPIQAETVAAAMLTAAKENREGVFIHEYREMMANV